MDREEIVIVGTLPALEGEFAEGDAGGAERAAAEAGRISRFRETTRDERIEIARQAEHRYGRKVAWGARLGDTEQLFTVASVPVMTRLRQPERVVLDTLVDAGRGPLALRRAGLGGPAGRPARRRVAGRAADGHGQGGRPAGQGPDGGE